MGNSFDDFDNNNEEYYINTDHLIKFFIRNKYIIICFSFLSLIFGFLRVNSLDKIWEGEFTIVLASKDKDNSISSNLLFGNNPLGFNLINSRPNSIKNDLVILKSPSVLMPIYEYVKKEKFKKGEDTSSWKFKDWENSVKVDLVNKTTVMKVTYRDKDKEIISNVLDKISTEYQTYSVRDQNQIIMKTENYFDQQIDKYSKKVLESAKNVSIFGKKNGLILVQTKNDNSSISGVSKVPFSFTTNVELINNTITSELNYANNLLKLFNKNKDKFPDLILILTRNFERDSKNVEDTKAKVFPSSFYYLLDYYEELNNKIYDFRRFYKPDDFIYKSLEKEKLNLEKTIKYQTENYLKSFIRNKEAALKLNSKPLDVINKFKTLLSNSVRDENTLNTLLIQKRELALKKAKAPTPWEVITLPNTYDYPISPRKSRVIPPILLLGFSFSIITAYLIEKFKNNIYHSNIICQKLKLESLLNLQIDDKKSWEEEIKLIYKSLKIKIKKRKIAFFFIGEFENNLKLSIKENFRKYNKDFELLFYDDLSLADTDEINIVFTTLGQVKNKEIDKFNNNVKLLKIIFEGIIFFESKREDFILKKIKSFNIS